MFQQVAERWRSDSAHVDRRIEPVPMHPLYQRLKELDANDFEKLVFHLLKERHPGVEGGRRICWRRRD